MQPLAAPLFVRCALPTDPASTAVIRNLREQGLVCADHGLYCDGRFETALSQTEITHLEESGIAVEIIRKTDKPATVDASIATGFVSAYLDTAGIHAAYTALQAAFPALSVYSNLPESTSGYDGSAPGLGGPSPVKLFRITTTPASTSKPALLIVAGLHAREWAPPLAALEFASQLLNNYDPASADPDVIAVTNLVDNLDILIVGAANPDGISYSRHDENMWRKNRRPNAGFPLCPGVDLNRNFSIFWGEAGSSPDPCDFQVYHGPSPFSEPEDRNLRAIVEQFPNILAAIDCHSFGEDFLRPQPGGGSFIGAEPVNTADNAIYNALEASMNSAIGAVSPGKSYSTGTTSNHAGTFDEYMFFGHRIFAFELEIGQDFQPPIADALVSVQEAAAAMRALAAETRDLATRFVTPATVVQVVDKSTSMIFYGYVDSTRANAARLIDLMSLNDSTSIVSFSTNAVVELPLTAIDSPGDYSTARSAVAGIGFGGSTSIGAGLQLGISLLPPPGQPRSLVLLSDGFQNTAPMVDLILPSVPAGVPVHTVALGLASDQPLLQHIAAETGGEYFFSPDELGLFDIYNVTHSTVADADMVLNETAPVPPNGFSRRFVIDCDADFAGISIALHDSHGRMEVSLKCVSVESADLSRIERRAAPGYQVMRWRRPQPGIYELRVTAFANGPVNCSVAAFVQSPLRLKFDTVKGNIKMGQPIDLPFTLLSAGRPVENVSVTAHMLSPASSTRLLARQWKKGMRLPKEPRGDSLPETVLRALAVRESIRAATGRDPFQYVRKDLHLVHPKLVNAKETSFALRAPTAVSIDGTYNIRFQAHGRTPSGCPFVRVGFRSVLAGG